MAIVTANGLKDIVRYFEQLPEVAEQAAVLALNQTADREGLAMLRRDMREEVNFPKGYLERGDRLSVTKRARKGDLQAIIRGRDQATSLARFATPGQRPENTRKGGVKVQVKPGVVKKRERFFMVSLRNGNTGLAVRLKPGETLRKSEKAVRLADGVFLLYGPSVDQVFEGVSGDVAPDILDQLGRQFLRQFDRLSNGK